MAIGEKVVAGLTVKGTENIAKLFFASHIENLKTNLREKFIENQISDKNIEKLFRNYLSVLYKRCNTLNTIMFPQEEILLESIYEPLLLREQQQYQNHKNNVKYAEKIIHDDIDKNMLLIDTAGMGKSTFTKFLILRIMKNQMHSKIPLFIELRKIRNEETLLEYIVNEINANKKEIFTSEMLLSLMEKGKFIFFLDGFDEVSEENRDTLGQQISEVSTNFSKNLIVLTSREQAFIPELHHKITCHFEPLNLKQIKSLILKYDASVNINIGKNLIQHENFTTLNYQLFNTPLMVNLLYKSFGYNNTIDDNVVTFYNEMFDALYKGHDLTKAGFDRKKVSNLKFEEFKTLFNAFSFISLYENKASFKTKMEIIDIINKAKKLSSINIENSEDFLTDLLNSVPLLTRDGLEYKFMHKTIMEFFAAEFLNYSEISHSLFTKIKDSNKLDNFTKCFEFLYEINSSLYIKEIGKKFLVEFISFYKNPKNRQYNDIFKTILFFNQDSIFTTYRKHDDLRKVPKNFRSSHGRRLKNEQYISISFKHSHKKILNAFLKDLIIHHDLDIKIYNDEKEINYLFSHLKIEKGYSLLSNEILSLQDSKILQTFILKIIVPSFQEPYSIYSLDINKCETLLDSVESKIDILA